MTLHTPYNETIVDQHTRQAEGYARLTQGMIASDRRAGLRAFIGLTAQDQVLDVACGPGSLALDLAPHAARVTGYDITPAMLDQARAAQARLGIDNVEWILGDAAGLPFPDGAFDVVGSSAAFHHFEQPAFVLAEMARVCRPGGRVVVLDVTPDADKATAYDRMERLRDPSHGHAHTIAEFEALGRDAGLGEARTVTNLTAPMPYAAVIETSFPETCTRDQLLAMMRDDAASGEDRLGFRAQIQDCAVMVTYPMSMIAWTKP
ncbi:methyltransferase domain-containing protein [Novosphingobium sp. PS1R-30]|uniref:Methyltransferase domain-containing protein n=1 Tax=Novosphingobium anseongense TaxID=3133436 RepID=A0ABU8RRS6_9SPHN